MVFAEVESENGEKFEVYLDTIHPLLLNKMIDALKEKNVLEILGCMEHDERIFFTADNMKMLKNLRIYEKALLNSCQNMETGVPPIRKKNSNSHFLKALFFSADREELIKKGDPLPIEQETYTLYRGVAGNGSARRKRDLSWTSSFDVAKWQAKQLESSKPMVYMAQVPRENIFFYINAKEEFICDITDDIKLVEVWRDEESTEMEPSTV